MALPELEQALELAPGNAGVLSAAADQLPWLGQSGRAVELIERATRLDPISGYPDILAQAYFFVGRFDEAAAALEGMDSPIRWPQLFATLSYAQLGRAAELDRWRARFVGIWPGFSWERSVAESGDFAPAARAERALWAEGLAKAGPPLCTSAEQLAATPTVKRLPECDAQRAKGAAPASAARAGAKP